MWRTAWLVMEISKQLPSFKEKYAFMTRKHFEKMKMSPMEALGASA